MLPPIMQTPSYFPMTETHWWTLAELTGPPRLRRIASHPYSRAAPRGPERPGETVTAPRPCSSGQLRPSGILYLILWLYGLLVGHDTPASFVPVNMRTTGSIASLDRA